MDVQFESEALRVNLERTRPQTIVIPDRYKILLDISRSAYGIHQRVDHFLKEYFHPYHNPEASLDLFRKLTLQDIWFFIEHDHHAQVLDLFCDIFIYYLSMDTESHVVERALHTMLIFMEKLHGEYPGDATDRIIARSMKALATIIPGKKSLLLKVSSHLKRLATGLVRESKHQASLFPLLRRALKTNMEFWLSNVDIRTWFESRKDLFDDGACEYIVEDWSAFLARARKKIETAIGWETLIDIPDFSMCAERLRGYLNRFVSPFQRVYYVIYLMHLPVIREDKKPLLLDLNRSLRQIHEVAKDTDLEIFMQRLFSFFSELKDENMEIVLDCIHTFGKEIYATGDAAYIDKFQTELIEFGFVGPNLKGVTEDWQVQVDPNHVKNIRVWLELIECCPKRSIKLLSALIVNLKIGGLFISDTDLFQRDITKLLNADIRPCYKLVKQLCRLFPVYFSEIGAEGELREITTTLDEISYRRDRLIHFLRKQVHTESNNTHVQLAEKIMEYWRTGDKSIVIPFIPEDIALSLKKSMEWFEPVHRIVSQVCDAHNISVKTFLAWENERVKQAVSAVEKVEETHRKRVLYLAKLYKLLKAKYTLSFDAVSTRIRRNASLVPSDADTLEQLLKKGDIEETIEFIFRLMSRLRRVILNPEQSRGREDIYHKRHIAVGIPSMYGRYLEPKFEALGLTFRLEKLAINLFSQLINRINLDFISARTMRRIADVMKLFQRGMELDGISHAGLNSNLMMFQYSLTTTSFSMGQFVNLFQFIARNIQEILQAYFLRHHDGPLRTIVTRRVTIKNPRKTPGQVLEHVHKISEKFYREIIASAFLIQPLDNFISRILNTLTSMVKTLTPAILRSVMSYDPDFMSSPIDEPTPEIDNQIFLGAKGYYLKKLHEIRFPIPSGFILTTEMFRRKEAIVRFPEMSREIFKIVSGRVGELERKTGLKYGDPTKPLLLSVRSGAAISLPGAMNTFLNVGLNDRIVETLSQQPNYGWTSWDCYRRFLQSWGMAYGIDRDEFDRTILYFKEFYGVKEKIQFSSQQMQTIAMAYKDVLISHGIRFESDPYRQLIQAILAVLDSWFTERAGIYRKQLQIAEEWGTAVIVQKMVLGNINYDSGTGVVFTQDPFSQSTGLSLYGDFTMFSQGEDVVAGLVHPLPVSEAQRRRSPSYQDISLEKNFPEIYEELCKRARELVYEYGFGHQEIEFTFETSKKEDLYILQTRDHTTRKEDKIAVFSDPEVSKRSLGTGIGIGGGAMNGIVSFDMEDLVRFRKEYPDEKQILVRPDTVPDDIGMIFECDGLLTARGGATSHAAVTAVRLGKTCVVNCRVLKVVEQEKRCMIGGDVFRSGDRIAIDGRLGHIYKGHFPIEHTLVALP